MNNIKCESLVSKAKSYGMEGVQIDGNNILTVYDTIKGVREYCIKQQKPYLIECMTFRMRGHEEASGVKYVPPHLFDEWAKKDPIQQYENYLLNENVLTQDVINIIKEEIKTYIEADVQEAYKAPILIPDSQEELNDVFAKQSLTTNNTVVEKKLNEQGIWVDDFGPTTELRFIDAIKEALHQSMQQHNNLVLMGQDIAEYGGAFKITEGFIKEFGKERVRNTPLCESAIIGTALGLSLEGFKSMVEMQFADFVSVGFNQIVNNLAKIHYRWGQNADVVVRMPCGGGVGAGPFHSQTNEAWFTKVAGLKVIYPSTPIDAKGLLIAAINDPNPVLFFEHKALYRSVQESVPNNYYAIEIGKANIVKEGTDITIITYGAGVHWVLTYLDKNTNISCELLDLRTLQPLDYDAIKKAVCKTGKVLIVHEDSLTGGFGGEISAWISEHCFEYLDAPVMRCASLDTPIPFNTDLEKNYLAKSKLTDYIQKLLAY
jgi:2-oxoisovalerate dehydrogenase E1 component